MFNNIASQDATGFLRDISGMGSDFLAYGGRWRWPAVVLTPEEYKLRVGGMSVTRLRQQLENYWGQGGILGAAVEEGYQDMSLNLIQDHPRDGLFDLIVQSSVIG